MASDRPSSWRKILTVIQKDDGGIYCKGSKYKGRLIWQDRNEETGEERFFVIKAASIFEPKEGSPEFVLQSICVNLDSEESVVELTD